MIGNKNMAIRIVDAYENLLKTIIFFSNCTPKEAEKVFELYQKNKIIKLDPVNGEYKVKHGIFFDKEVIWNAINK